MRVVADAGPLVAAANVRDEAHDLAAALVTEAAGELVVLDSVIVETDHLLRSRVGSEAARLFLRSLVEGEHRVAFLTRACFAEPPSSTSATQTLISGSSMRRSWHTRSAFGFPF